MREALNSGYLAELRTELYRIFCPMVMHTRNVVGCICFCLKALTPECCTLVLNVRLGTSIFIQCKRNVQDLGVFPFFNLYKCGHWLRSGSHLEGGTKCKFVFPS